MNNLKIESSQVLQKSAKGFFKALKFRSVFLSPLMQCNLPGGTLGFFHCNWKIFKWIGKTNKKKKKENKTFWITEGYACILKWLQILRIHCFFTKINYNRSINIRV